MAPEDTRVDTSSETGTDDPSTAGGQLVHLPVDRSAVGREDPARRGDVDEWGRSEHMRELARRLYDPIYRDVVPGRVGGPREDPHRRRRAARGQPRRRHPVRRPGDHARHRDRAGAGPSTGWPTTSSRALPVVGTLWARVGGVVAHPDNAYRLLREQQASSSSCSPRAPRARQDLRRALPAAPLRPGRLRRDRHAGRRADHPDRRGRRRGVDADPRQGRPRWPRRSACPYVPITANMLAARPARRGRLLPGQVQAPGARPGHLRRAARPGALLPQPDHGRVRGDPPAHPGGPLRHAPSPRARSGSG